jgi:hypothetical protein
MSTEAHRRHVHKWLLQRYHKRKAAGLCTKCGNKSDGHSDCATCRSRHNRYNRVNVKRRKLFRREKRSKGICIIDCCQSPAVSGKSMCKTHHAVRNEYPRKLRREVISHYGGRCMCCGITEFTMLTIDHIKNDGAQQREEIGGGYRFYCWLRRNKYPPEFQILCFNCNISKHLSGGVCAHKK